uniref:Uncharacterized protein n=1 Tax=Eucampia antarctica TaxID=49252 RepID=A0A7S2W0H6_9STRA
MTNDARRKISENNGYWPNDWCTPKDIRGNLNFKEILVTISGISNVSAATVYNSYTYRYADTIVGYEFAPLLYKTNTAKSSTKVDMSLVNDVVLQRGIEDDIVDLEPRDGFSARSGDCFKTFSCVRQQSV